MSNNRRFTSAKIVLLGGPGVGKTAFAVRYITKRYIGDYDRDKGTCDKDNCKVLCQFKTGQIQPCTAELAALDRVKKSLTYLSSIQNILSTCWLSEMLYTHKLNTARDEITLEILDTASQPSKECLEKHIKWGDGFILLYSITDRHSLTLLQEFWEIINSVKGQGREVPLVLVGNKSDLLTSREVTADEGIDLATHIDCPRFEISVAEGWQGVMEVMDELLCELKRDFIKSLSSATMASLQVEKPRSKLYSMKKAFKKRINKSHSDTF